MELQVRFCQPPDSLEPHIWSFGEDKEDSKLRGRKCHIETISTSCPASIFQSTLKFLPLHPHPNPSRLKVLLIVSQAHSPSPGCCP